jgi:hypothetical protein
VIAPLSPAHLLGLLLAGAGILWAVVKIGRFDRIAQVIVVVGVLLRLGAGIGLFLTSYHDVEWLRHARVGGGFWEPDALTYYTRAAEASRDGLQVISTDEASPTYVKALALSMDVLGISPLTGVYLNVVCYVAIGVLLVAAAGSIADGARRTATRLMLACFTLSPALILASGQSLKDQFFVAWLVVSSLAIGPVVRWLAGQPVSRTALGAAIPLLAVAVAIVSGIRPYVALFIVVALGLVTLVYLVRPQPVSALRRAGRGAAILILLWIAFAQGAGAYYAGYEQRVLGVLGIERTGGSAAAVVESAREGFVRSGGRTNIARPQSHAGDSMIRRLVIAFEALGIGLVLMVTPAAVVNAAGLVDLPDTGGMGRVIDLDTLFVALTCGAILWFARRHHGRFSPGTPYVMYTAVVAVITTVLMAYVVTNLGTLFRLRTIPAAWIWLLPLALSPVLGGDEVQRAAAGSPSLATRNAAVPTE